MSLIKQYRPTKDQSEKWEQIFFENKHIPLYLNTTTQVKSVELEPGGLIFVNRNDEKQSLKKILETIAKTRKPLAIRISGAGGVGKTHFLRYIQDLIKRKDIKKELKLDLEDIHFDCCIMDAPKHEEEYNFYNIYTQIWDGFGKEDFFEEFSTSIFIKLLKILNNSATSEIDGNLKIILGQDWRFWKDFNYQEVRGRLEKLSAGKFSELKKIFENNYNVIIKSIKDEFLLNKEEFLQINFHDMFSNILSLIDILIPNFSLCEQYIETWQLINLDDTLSPAKKEEYTLKKLNKLLEVYRWLYPKFIWILELDDLDHLNNSDISQKLFDLLKIFRNLTNNICIILTATTDQWNYFDKSIENTDKSKQLKGLFPSDDCCLELTYLPDEEVLDWISRIIQRWWDQFDIKVPLDGTWYPFSRNAVEFIINYEPNDKFPRSIGDRLIGLWDKLKEIPPIAGKLFVESEYYAWRLMNPENYTKLNLYIQQLLLSYQKIEEYGAFSGAIEDGIKEIIDILQDSQEFKVIEIVEAKRNKEFTDERFKTKKHKRRADVYIELQEPGGVDTTKIEIQVKAGDPNREITNDELASSFELLEFNHIDFLIIVSFSELNSATKLSLERFHGRFNLTATKLTSEQRSFCVLIAYFNDITGRKLTPLEAATSFEKIFSISFYSFFRSWLDRKKDNIEKDHKFDTLKISPKKIQIATPIGLNETIESILKPSTPIPPKPDPEKVKLLQTIKWMIKKGIERKKESKNRISKTWLLKLEDRPAKEVLDKAWQELIEIKQYGKLVKQTFFIDLESIKDLLK